MRRPDSTTRWNAAALLLLTMACGHSESFTTSNGPLNEPLTSTPPIQLTYNVGDNYAPSWSEDNQALLYQYSRIDLLSDDRCAALLPPSGGTRLWQFCDERREHSDSADSFPSIAVGSDGRLLYVEASSRRGSGGASGVNPAPQTVNLWLADTAHPFVRQRLLALPTPVSGTSVNWLGQARWIGPTSFVALAQVLTPFSTCQTCAFFDSMLTTVALVRGEIGAGGATLTPVAGTQGVAWFSLVDNNASLIVYTSGLSLQRLPLTGGTGTTVASIPEVDGRIITGFSCQSSQCVVITRTPGHIPPPPFPQFPPVFNAWRIPIPGGEATDLGEVVAQDSPLLSPTSTDFVARMPLDAGTHALFLYKGIRP